MINKKVAIEVLNEALATGADFAEIFFTPWPPEPFTVDCVPDFFGT